MVLFKGSTKAGIQDSDGKSISSEDGALKVKDVATPKSNGMTTNEYLELILKEMRMQTEMMREAFDFNIKEEDL